MSTQPMGSARIELNQARGLWKLLPGGWHLTEVAKGSGTKRLLPVIHVSHQFQSQVFPHPRGRLKRQPETRLQATG